MTVARRCCRMIFLALWFACYATVANAAQPKPEFDFSCSLHARDTFETDDLAPAPPGVSVTWQAKNANRVFINGQPAEKPDGGTIEGPGSWEFVAIGPGGTVFKPLICELRRNFIGKAGDYHISFELLHLPNSALKKTLTTKHRLDEISDVVIQALQKMQFPATRDPGVSVLDGVYLYTPEFVTIDAIGDKRIEREVAFQIMVRPKDWQPYDAYHRPTEPPSRDIYDVDILPVVFMRFRMEGGEFEKDPEALKFGTPLAEKLFKSIEDAL